jgi:hypothetical protein
VKLSHLSNNELIDQLTLRTDLTDIEHELLDRLIRACDAMASMCDKCAAKKINSAQMEFTDGTNS